MSKWWKQLWNIKFSKIWILRKNNRKLQDSSILRLQIFKFSMLTHVCGVARGSRLTWCEALSVMMCLGAAEGQNPALSAQKWKTMAFDTLISLISRVICQKIFFTVQKCQSEHKLLEYLNFGFRFDLSSSFRRRTVPPHIDVSGPPKMNF